jgi:hypothetical protein
MGVIQFRIGRRHGKAGLPYLIHRNQRRYDGASDNDSYLHGYKYGEKERLMSFSERVTHTKTGEENVGS